MSSNPFSDWLPPIEWRVNKLTVEDAEMHHQLDWNEAMTVFRKSISMFPKNEQEKFLESKNQARAVWLANWKEFIAKIHKNDELWYFRGPATDPSSPEGYVLVRGVKCIDWMTRA